MTRQAQPPNDGRIIIEDEALRGGFTQIPNAILGRQDLSPGAKLAYMGLLSFAWQTDSCFPGQEKLADHLGVGKRSIIRYLQDLQDAGLLRIERRGLGKTNLYYLPRVASTRGRSAKMAPPEMPRSAHQEVPNLHLEEYEVEEDSVEQHSGYISKRDISLSKFRKGTPKDFQEERPKPRSTPLALSEPRSSGFASVASVLAEASHPTGREAGRGGGSETAHRDTPPARAQDVPTSQATGPQNAGLAAAPAGAAGTALSRSEKPENGRKARRAVSDTTPRQSSLYSEDCELVAAYIRDFALEFHDQASLKASVTRALHLLSESGYPRERWSEKLYEARALTKERSAAIGYQGNGKPRASAGAGGAIDKMPYYFELLACVLGLHDHAAGQHPLPPTEQEFKRQQGRAAEPERKSLAGRYAHLVRR